ncbi:MAG: hypothetical protein H0T41_10785 [Rhodobacteraceae bacterium]|nr:hypothetical protein [Paracoccaceae bacterium]
MSRRALQLEGRRYRYGFLALQAGGAPRELADTLLEADWRRRRLDDFDLWTHPETQAQSFPNGGATFVFLGDVFSEAGRSLADWSASIGPDDDAALHEALDELSGRFALLVVAGGRLRVYHDAFGSRAVYYHAARPAGVASHAPLLAEAVGAGRDPEMASYIAHREFVRLPRKCLPGDGTLYTGIRGLIPNSYLEVETGELHRYWPREPIAPTDLDAFMDKATASVEALAGYVRGRYLPVFGVTGGADSRAAMAIFRMRDTPFETVTWSRKNLFSGETVIIDDMVRHLGVRHAYAAKPKEAEDIGRLAAENSGLYPPFRTLGPLRKRFKRRTDHVFVRGWGAEILRGFYNLHEAPMKALTAEDMTFAYSSPAWTDAAQKRTAERCFEGFAVRAGYGSLRLDGIDPNDLFYWEHRMGMWCPAALNGFDTLMPTLVAFNGRKLFTAAWGLPAEQRLSKELMLELARRGDPVLGAFPMALKPVKPERTRRAWEPRLGPPKPVKPERAHPPKEPRHGAPERRVAARTASAAPTAGSTGSLPSRLKHALQWRLRRLLRKLKSPAPRKR